MSTHRGLLTAVVSRTGTSVALMLGASGLACNSVFGLDGYAPAGDAAAGNPGAAVSVASSNDEPVWCVVTADGNVECWGENDSGQLGDGTTTSRATRGKVLGLPGPAADVSVGDGTACARTRAGGAYCWGVGADGQLGNASATPSSTMAVAVNGLESGVTALSVGHAVACAVQNGAALCWGNGQFGLLGTNQASNALTPTQVSGLQSGVTSISAGESSACAVKDGAVLCWGGLEDGSGTCSSPSGENCGELGSGARMGSRTPVALQGFTGTVAQVSVGGGFACAVTTAGAAWCWGDGTGGALGNGQLTISAAPVQVEGLANGVVAVSAGANSVTAIRKDGAVVSWGYGAGGVLGNDFISGSSTPSPVNVQGVAAPATTVSTGAAPCVTTTTGLAECWGFTAELALVPVPVSNLPNATSVAVGGAGYSGTFACATTNLRTYCWGSNTSGQLGNQGTKDSPTPQVVGQTLVEATSVSAGAKGDFACAAQGGLVLCWGDNSMGQLGNGSTVASATPTMPVIGLTNAATVSTGAASACALTTGGGLYCWGDNAHGQLGNGSTSSSPSLMPIQVLASGVTAVSVGSTSACALLSDGSVDCWGDNSSGQLGDGTNGPNAAPAAVRGLAGVKAISVGWVSACAVLADGTIRCWGDNSFGELGSGSTTGSAVPVAVKNISSGATQVSVGAYTACAIVNGGAQCWGNGPLGDGSNHTVPWPVPVNGLGNGVSAIAVGPVSSCAIVNNGVQCWGLNSAGQLGNGGTVDEAVATPVSGFP